MTTVRPPFFDDDLAARADAVARDAVARLVDGVPVITVSGRQYHVVVVAAPAGAGKTEFVCSVVEVAVKRYPGRSGVIAVATPTNDQAYELVRRIAGKIRATVAFVPASDRTPPPATLALPNVAQVEAVAAGHHAVIVGTLDKVCDVFARGYVSGFKYLVIDEAYQADSARYYGVAGIADRHLLVGDPGQLDPFTTMNDPDRWRGLREDPTQTAVGVVHANHPSVPVIPLPITRRLPPRACSRSMSTGVRIGRRTLTCMLCSALGSRTEWRSTSLRCGSNESRSAGRGRFSTASSARSAGSTERERPWHAPSILAGAIATSGVRRTYRHSGRRRVTAGNSSCSRPREGRCDWRAATVGRGSGFCSAGMVADGNRTRRKQCDARCSAWRRGSCPSRCGNSCGCQGLCAELAFDNDKSLRDAPLALSSEELPVPAGRSG